LPSPPPPPPPSPPPGNASFQIEYSTLLGGTGFEEIREPKLLSGGRLLFGARTLSANAPVRAGAYQPSHGGGTGDAYLAIMNRDGTQLEAATFFGGSGMERPPYGIAVTSNGDIVFTTGSTSPNIPTSASSYRRNLHSPVPSPGGGFVCRISGNLTTLRWCSYLDGGWPRGGLILDGQDNVIITGGPAAQNFQVTSGAFHPSGTRSFTLKLNSAGTAAIFAAGFGGISMRMRSSGDLSMVGISSDAAFPTTSGAAQTTSIGLPDAYAAVMRSDGTGLVYSTLLSGSGVELAEHPHVLLPDGSILFSGVTASGDLFSASGNPGGQNDAFLAKLNSSGSAYEYVRYLGGSGDDFLLGPVLDAQGNIYMYGNTASRNFPTTVDAVQTDYRGGAADAVFLILSPDGSQIRFATYLGGNGDELIRGLVIGSSGEVYLVGRTDSSNFPTTPGAFQRQPGGDADGFVVKLVPVDN
jgi:hypothetical protein